MLAQQEEYHKYEVDIEGAYKPWDKDTITTEEVAALGGWDVSEGVVLIDLEDGTERNLDSLVKTRFEEVPAI